MDKDEEVKAIGERIYQLRKDRGLSQRQLSEPGVTPSYISRIEKGDRLPSVRTLRRLAPKLGVSVEFLETGEEGEILNKKTVTEIHEYARRCADRGDTEALVELINRLVKQVNYLGAERYREALVALTTPD